MTYSIVYRTGGTHNCTWQRVFEGHADAICRADLTTTQVYAGTLVPAYASAFAR